MKKPKIFIQKCGTYTNEVLVVCGITKKETFRYLKKNNISVPFSKWVLEDFDEWYEDITKNKKLALFCNNQKIDVPSVLFLRKFDDSWEYWETLMHEIHHVVLYLAKQKGFTEELENQAYLFEHLFHDIRRKLSGVDKI